MMFIKRAAEVLLSGGVIAYPTEGVFGLGCMPDDHEAVARVLALKRRDAGKGLILIAASEDQLRDWIAPADGRSLPPPDPAHPVTWIVPPGALAHPAIRGGHTGIAVRLTTNPVARALCNAVDSALVSTSANISGRSVARNRFVLRRQFAQQVDYIVPGDCGPVSGPSEIRELASDRLLRPRP